MLIDDMSSTRTTQSLLDTSSRSCRIGHRWFVMLSGSREIVFATGGGSGSCGVSPSGLMRRSPAKPPTASQRSVAAMVLARAYVKPYCDMLTTMWESLLDGFQQRTRFMSDDSSTNDGVDVAGTGVVNGPSRRRPQQMPQLEVMHRAGLDLCHVCKVVVVVVPWGARLQGVLFRINGDSLGTLHGEVVALAGSPKLGAGDGRGAPRDSLHVYGTQVSRCYLDLLCQMAAIRCQYVGGGLDVVGERLGDVGHIVEGCKRIHRADNQMRHMLASTTVVPVAVGGLGGRVLGGVHVVAAMCGCVTKRVAAVIIFGHSWQTAIHEAKQSGHGNSFITPPKARREKDALEPAGPFRRNPMPHRCTALVAKRESDHLSPIMTQCRGRSTLVVEGAQKGPREHTG